MIIDVAIIVERKKVDLPCQDQMDVFGILMQSYVIVLLKGVYLHSTGFDFIRVRSLRSAFLIEIIPGQNR